MSYPWLRPKLYPLTFTNETPHINVFYPPQPPLWTRVPLFSSNLPLVSHSILIPKLKAIPSCSLMTRIGGNRLVSIRVIDLNNDIKRWLSDSSQSWLRINVIKSCIVFLSKWSLLSHKIAIRGWSFWHIAHSRQGSPYLVLHRQINNSTRITFFFFESPFPYRLPYNCF